MALADTGRAIGAVTQLLQGRLLGSLGALINDVTVGRPEPPQGSSNNPRLNLFLYEIQFDGQLKNLSLDEGQPAPLWLVLRYLLTAFDEQGESDSRDAHELLGQGIRALNDLNFFSLNGLPADTIAALEDNPDMLKLSFEESSSDLLSKLMQGSDEKYRCSVGFQVRPVMITSGEPPAYFLLVGINYQTGSIVGERGIQIPVLPSMGPSITTLSPSRFEVGSSLTVRGTDLHLTGLSVMLGPAELAVTAQQPDRLICTVSAQLAGSALLSAGSYPVAVAQTLPTGRRRMSNLLIGGLLPRLDSAVPSLPNPQPGVAWTVDLTGILLGTAEDDVFVGLYQNGRVVRLFDQFIRPVGPPPQTQMQLRIMPEHAVPPGTYRVILRVNGQQAVSSPEVVLAP